MWSELLRIFGGKIISGYSYCQRHSRGCAAVCHRRLEQTRELSLLANCNYGSESNFDKTYCFKVKTFTLCSAASKPEIGSGALGILLLVKVASSYHEFQGLIIWTTVYGEENPSRDGYETEIPCKGCYHGIKTNHLRNPSGLRKGKEGLLPDWIVIDICGLDSGIMQKLEDDLQPSVYIGDFAGCMIGISPTIQCIKWRWCNKNSLY
ncbi:hypothetical protein F5878DRAFT_711824 [Lentinula raphanica]|uniref:Uncharacterized protein n=1 Tax=Lentinula raphanica TaxID=153919 RepID=A0AA38UF59_9AGAR|nr:hypothetical protein F5878DRAFT_711824 [Lentinula raphanica]